MLLSAFYTSKLFYSFQGVSYSEPPTCHPRDPATFTLPIRFQQVPDPVPAQFTLSAKFLLMAERNLWLNGDADKMDDFHVDAAFSRGAINLNDINDF